MDGEKVLVMCMDALTLELVEKYDCKNLMQNKKGFYGKTDISDFKIAQSNILWPSFLQMENKQDKLLKMLYFLRIDPETILKDVKKMEDERPGLKANIWKFVLKPKRLEHLQNFVIPIPLWLGSRADSGIYGRAVSRVLGDFIDYRSWFKQVLVDLKIPESKTFLNYFYPQKHIDFPCLSSYRIDHHRPIRRLVPKLGKTKTLPKDIKNYNKSIWKLNIENEIELFETLEQQKNKLVLYYNSTADYIGHHSFGNEEIMEKVYTELDGLAEKAGEYGDIVWVVSDHEMEQVFIDVNGKKRGLRFGDHLDMQTGFYSVNRSLDEIREKYGERQLHDSFGPLQRLEEGKPRLTDMGYLISIYGNKTP